MRIEIAGLDTAPAQELLAELDRLRSVLNVFRGHAVVVRRQEMGGESLSFADIPDVSRGEVILPDAVLEDVDLVAQDRAFGAHNPVLFSLLEVWRRRAPRPERRRPRAGRRRH